MYNKSRWMIHQVKGVYTMTYESKRMRNPKYRVEVENLTLVTDFNYGGYMECLKFIHDNGVDGKSYKVEVIDYKDEEDMIQ